MLPSKPCMHLSMHTAFHMRLLPTGHGSAAGRAQDDGLAPPAGRLPVGSVVLKLEQRGLIRRTPGKARGIELLVTPENLAILR